MNSKTQCLTKSERLKRVAIYLVIVAFCVFLDQITKIVTAKSGKTITIIPKVLRVFPVENSGMAFGMLSGWKYAQTMFIIVTIILLVLVAVYVVLSNRKSKLLHSSIALMYGGAIGNFIDRVAFRKVRDFLELDLKIRILQFNCNVADIFITVGAVLFFGYLIFGEGGIFSKNKDEKSN